MSRRFMACPDCGLPIGDEAEARLGFCSHCAAFTGMCAAGRKIISPDVMSVTSWHLPCTVLGVMTWEITYRGRTFIARLCGEHDAQLRAGNAHWITAATLLSGETVPRPRSPA
jgi:hypothetical protein